MAAPTTTPATPPLDKVRKEMGLVNQKCCYITQKGTPCKWPTSSTQSEINSRIISLFNATLTPEDLMEGLRELVSLVNCSQAHQADKFKEPRVKQWRSIFPAGSTRPPVGEQIGDLVRKVSKTCSGQGKNGPCGWKLGGQRLQNAAKTTLELMRPEIYLDEDDRDYALEVIIENSFCHIHIDQGDELLETWRLKISQLCRDIDRPKATSASSPATESWIHRSCREGTPPAACWPDAPDVSPFRTRIEPNRPATKEDAYLHVRNEIDRSFDADDKKAGYVYAYTVPGNEGFVKIGYTTRSIGEREDEWTFECNRKSKVVYPDLDDLPLDKVPHAKRVEQLCLAELKYRSERVVCDACIQEHIEWLKVPVKEAVAIIEKWTKWIHTEPYVERWEEHRREFVWRLDQDVYDQSENMVQFMKDVTKQCGSEVRSKKK